MSSLQSSIDTHEVHFVYSNMLLWRECLWTVERHTHKMHFVYIALQYVVKNGWHRQEYLLSTHFNKNEMKSLLQKMFVSVESIGKHKTWHILLRTPKVPRQQAVYGIVAQLAAQRTKLEKHVELAKKYPNARCFKKHVKFSPKFKSKRGWNNDAIAIEKKSFHM